jgi:hypothetical protein
VAVQSFRCGQRARQKAAGAGGAGAGGACQEVPGRVAGRWGGTVCLAHLAGWGHQVPLQVSQDLALLLAQQAGRDACRRGGDPAGW